MNPASAFEEWRITNSPINSWGLAWFLSNELCKRFYASHGLVPWVIDHDGLGYYGITLNTVGCKIAPRDDEPLGRLTMFGDVENWQSGGPGDHGLNTIKLCERGVSTTELIRKTIDHLRLKPFPEKSHLMCRHKRWGDSYQLCFEIATLMAISSNLNDLQIWNHPYHTGKIIRSMDDRHGMTEHPGGFIFQNNNNQLVVTGDGRVLNGDNINLWERHMQGEGSDDLAAYITRKII